jgi:hypothetical protein
MSGYPPYMASNQSYPSLMEPSLLEPEGTVTSTNNGQEELNLITQYIKDLRIPEKR